MIATVLQIGLPDAASNASLSPLDSTGQYGSTGSGLVLTWGNTRRGYFALTTGGTLICPIDILEATHRLTYGSAIDPASALDAALGSAGLLEKGELDPAASLGAALALLSGSGWQAADTTSLKDLGLRSLGPLRDDLTSLSNVKVGPDASPDDPEAGL